MQRRLKSALALALALAMCASLIVLPPFGGTAQAAGAEPIFDWGESAWDYLAGVRFGDAELAAIFGGTSTLSWKNGATPIWRNREGWDTGSSSAWPLPTSGTELDAGTIEITTGSSSLTNANVLGFLVKKTITQQETATAKSMSYLFDVNYYQGIAIWINGELYAYQGLRAGQFLHNITGLSGASSGISTANKKISTVAFGPNDKKVMDGSIVDNLKSGQANEIVVALFTASSNSSGGGRNVYFDAYLGEKPEYEAQYITVAPGSVMSDSQQLMNFTWWTNKDTSADKNGAVKAIVQIDDDQNFDDDADTTPTKTYGDGTISAINGAAGYEKASVTDVNVVDGFPTGTTLYYRVGGGKDKVTGETVWSDAHELIVDRTLNAYNAILVSDCQLDNVAPPKDSPAGTLSPSTQAWINTLAAAANRAGNAVAVINAGDVVNSADSTAQWEEHFKVTQLGSYPVAAVPGNHDETSSTNYLYSHYTFPNQADTKDGNYNVQSSTAGADYWYRIGDVLYFNLVSGPDRWSNNSDSSYAKTDAHIKTWALAKYNWMNTTIEEQDPTWIIMVMHFDMYGAGYHAVSEGSTGGAAIANMNWDAGDVRNTLAPYLDDLGVDLVINGHEHLYSRSKVMGDGTTATDADKNAVKSAAFTVDTSAKVTKPNQVKGPIDATKDDRTGGAANPGTYIDPDGVIYVTLSSASAMKNNAPYPALSGYNSNPEKWLAYYNAQYMGSDGTGNTDVDGGRENATMYSILDVSAGALTLKTYWTTPGEREPIVDQLTIKKTADKAALQELHDSLSGDTAVATKLTAALTAAQNVLANNAATEEQIGGAFDTLFTAFNDLDKVDVPQPTISVERTDGGSVVMPDDAVSYTLKATATPLTDEEKAAGITQRFQWYLNGAPIDDGSGISGTKTDTLTVSSFRMYGAQPYTCKVTNTGDAVKDAMSATLSEDVVKVTPTYVEPENVLKNAFTATISLYGTENAAPTCVITATGLKPNYRLVNVSTQWGTLRYSYFDFEEGGTISFDREYDLMSGGASVGKMPANKPIKVTEGVASLYLSLVNLGFEYIGFGTAISNNSGGTSVPIKSGRNDGTNNTGGRTWWTATVTVPYTLDYAQETLVVGSRVYSLTDMIPKSRTVVITLKQTGALDTPVRIEKRPAYVGSGPQECGTLDADGRWVAAAAQDSATHVRNPATDKAFASVPSAIVEP